MTDAPTTLGDELDAAHARFWVALGRPGTWWTGTGRVAIAAETRAAGRCDLCAARKDAVSPAAVGGAHLTVADGLLSEGAVDAVHRIATDPGRLTESWLRATLGADFTEGHYVELLGIVCCVVAIDRVNTAAGLPVDALPEPRPGEPSGERPANLDDIGAWVPVAAAGDHAPKGRVLRALTLVPQTTRETDDLNSVQYLDPDGVMDVTKNGDRAISRSQMELIAARVSALNECFY